MNPIKIGFLPSSTAFLRQVPLQERAGYPLVRDKGSVDPATWRSNDGKDGWNGCFHCGKPWIPWGGEHKNNRKTTEKPMMTANWQMTT